ACMLAIAVLAAVAVWGMGVPGNPLKASYQRTVKDLHRYAKGDARGSVGARLETDRAALMNFPQKPILGWSEQGYRDQLKQQVAKKELKPIVLKLSHSHNVYLETLIYMGVVGLLPMLALFLLPF